MKGCLKFGVLALVIVLVSWCGSAKGKVLSCSKSVTEDEGSSKETIKLTFNDEKVSKIGMEIEMTLKDGDVTTFKTFYDAAFGEMAKKDGIKYSSKASGKTLKLSVEADVNKVSKEDLESIDLSVPEGTYDEIKKDAENDGYTCK